MPPPLESVAAPSAVLPGLVTPGRAAERVLETIVVVVGAVAAVVEAAAVGIEVARYSAKPSLQHLQYH